MPAAPPTGTVTFLFTDIEGSTSLWESHPDAMRPALARHDVLLRRAVERNGGYVFKTVGDAFYAAFAVAGAALEAALAAQTGLCAEPPGLPTPLSVRMALHTGACEERGGDYFGPPLNRVARLVAAGHGGQVLLSEATQALVRDALPPGAALQDLGERRFKGLQGPQRVFQLLHPALPADFAPLRSLDDPTPPNNLPQQTTSFIGREGEVAEVKALMRKSRLVTLVGAGGAGKTRLSLQVAADLLAEGDDGVWLAELASLSDPALLPQIVAQMLGIKEQGGRTMADTLTDALKTRHLLLILDNCEHILPACAALASGLLRACPHVRLLASSREALNVAGEQTYRIPGLSLPDPRQAQTAEAVSRFEAVLLFLERAQAVQPSFTVTDSNAAAMAQVCRQLDGIPLAIELAAARVRAMPVEQVMARLEDRFRLLTGGSRTALPRQQTLRALIDWSHDLLTEREKTLLRRLSVFAGGWTLEAAEHVCSGGDVEDAGVLDLLVGQVDKSLVVYEEQAGGAARYRLLETMRQYARDRLAESGEAEAVRGRHAAWFLALAESAERQARGPEEGAWLRRLEVEHDNLRSSLSWYERSAEGAEAGLRLAAALWWLWSVRGNHSEGRQWLDRALAKAAGPDGAAESNGAVESNGAGGLNGTAGAGAAPIRARALYGAGILASEQGDSGAARVLFEESLTIAREVGNRNGVAYSLLGLGIVAFRQGDHAPARALLEECLTILRGQGDQTGITVSLNILGIVAERQGDPALARALHEESLAIARRLGNQNGIAAALSNLGNVAFRQGDLAAARASLEECLTILRRLGGRLDTADSLEGLAGVAHAQGRSARAARLLGAACSLRETIGNPPTSAEREEIAGRIASVREALGAEAFHDAWAIGQGMGWEQTVDYALTQDEGSA